MNMQNIPRPTDDELLMYFVDGHPEMAMRDYRRRTCIWWEQLLTSSLTEAFEFEWRKRGVT